MAERSHAQAPMPAVTQIGLILGLNVALVLTTWVMTKKFTLSLHQPAERREVPEVGPVGSH
jgi:hypothetical protein